MIKGDGDKPPFNYPIIPVVRQATIMSNYQLVIRAELSSNQGQEFASGYDKRYTKSRDTKRWNRAVDADQDTRCRRVIEVEECGDCKIFFAAK